MTRALTGVKPDLTRPPVWCTRCNYRGHPLMPGLGPFCAGCEHWDVHPYDVEAFKAQQRRIEWAEEIAQEHEDKAAECKRRSEDESEDLATWARRDLAYIAEKHAFEAQAMRHFRNVHCSVPSP